MCDVRADFATGVCLQLCVQKCGCAKFCIFTHVWNVHMQIVCDVHAGFAHIIANKLHLQNLYPYHTHFACAHFADPHFCTQNFKQTLVAKYAHTFSMCADDRNFVYSHFVYIFLTFCQQTVVATPACTSLTFGTYADLQNFGHLHICTPLQRENSHTCMHINHISHVCKCSKFHTWYKVQSIMECKNVVCLCAEIVGVQSVLICKGAKCDEV